MKGPERPPGMEPERVPDAATQAEAERQYQSYKGKRDAQIWNMVVGVAMMFLAGIFWPLALGGAAMVLYGGWTYWRWNRRMHQVYDPWEDAEIDAWEQEHFGG